MWDMQPGKQQNMRRNGTPIVRMGDLFTTVGPTIVDRTGVPCLRSTVVHSFVLADASAWDVAY